MTTNVQIKNLGPGYIDVQVFNHGDYGQNYHLAVGSETIVYVYPGQWFSVRESKIQPSETKKTDT